MRAKAKRKRTVLETSVDMIGRQEWERSSRPDSRIPDASLVAAQLERHFRDNYPILLDGALPLASDQGHFLRQARESLIRGKTDPGLLPAAVLREALDSIVPGRTKPTTVAGLTAIGPHCARVWWDESLLDNLDDILSGLDRPRPVLRFFDVTGLNPDGGRWHESFDVDIALADKGRTVELLKADHDYVVDLGYLYADGRILRLARTNTVGIPREGRAEAIEAETVRSCLRPRVRKTDAKLIPDALAREWIDSRPDHARRDVDAELLIHMLYRAFLLEGSRALRRSGGRPVRRDAAVLENEHRRRQRARARRAAPKRVKKAAPAFLITRLDTVKERETVSRIAYPPVPAASISAAAALARDWPLTADRYGLLCAAVAYARLGRRFESAPRALAASSAPNSNDAPVSAPAPAAPTPAAAALPSVLASPVFEAAKSLRERLSSIPSLPQEVSVVRADAPEPKPAPVRSRDFGGSEARRFAKAGVRVTRMALTLEGRMRPGARLKVAGKLVYADADGCFKLECVLTGRRASIPMTAGTSIGGEARSVVNIDWEKRSSRVRKTPAG